MKNPTSPLGLHRRLSVEASHREEPSETKQKEITIKQVKIIEEKKTEEIKTEMKENEDGNIKESKPYETVEDLLRDL